jgi:alkylation response protein AidB-like acyl-CoA dehydrogenase
MIDLNARLDSLTDDERMIRDAASDYCSRDPEMRRVRDLRGQRPSHDPGAWREMAAMGWLGCNMPEHLGGTLMTHSQRSLLLEQYGRSLAPEPLIAAAILGGGIVLRGSNEALKERWLPSLVSGDWVPSLAWQEAPAQSCVDSITTRATLRNGSLVLDGSKRFVPNGESAHAFVVSATGHDGFGLYVVGRDAPGLKITIQERVDGGTWTALELEGVAVSADSTVASGPAASTVLERVLDEGRLAVSAELVGLMSRAFEMTVDYIKVREQFGKRIGSFQALQHRATDLLSLVELSRAVLRQSARRFDESDNVSVRAQAASQAKARAADAALKVVKGCIQLHGGIGYTDEHNIGLFLKRAMVLASWLGGAAEHRSRFGRMAEEMASEVESSAPLGPFRADVRRYLADHFPSEWCFPPTRMSLKETELWQRKLAEKGWMAPGWPTEYGGMGLPAFDQIGMQEEFDRHGVSIIPNNGVALLGPLLIRYGSDEQKRTHLPCILSGEVLWAQGYSEPGAGSDLASVRTRAVLDGDSFIVNGQKTWTSFAHEADMIFLLARTDQAAKKQDGISFLLADIRSPGITVRRIRNLTGESEFCEVFFDNVRVPRESLVGALNKGWSMAKSLLGSERISIGSPRLAKYPLRLLRGLMMTGGRFEEPLVRARFDELRLDVEDLGALFVRMAEVLRRGGELGAEVSILKIWVTEAMQRVTDLMLEFQAEQGTVDEPVLLTDGTAVHVAGQYFLSRPATIYGGSSEIQRNILAKAVLDLPG